MIIKWYFLLCFISCFIKIFFCCYPFKIILCIRSFEYIKYLSKINKVHNCNGNVLIYDSSYGSLLINYHNYYVYIKNSFVLKYTHFIYSISYILLVILNLNISSNSVRKLFLLIMLITSLYFSSKN
ncbi:hypothetical protein JSR06_00070 [Candidatus Vidania fulgoroideae]|uniref:Uncharacterized protein n=1 Tax=Candidatus Vidania fulgoroideorum TaxID=881286 RepID=A0A974X7G1_9PROT|nr:hypothetical protein JSR06_00070 [Candidatus Vidania fulgoroideae]